jgi:hypothetical protein
MQILRFHTSILITIDYRGVSYGNPLFIRVVADLVLVMDKERGGNINKSGEFEGVKKEGWGGYKYVIRNNS